MSKRISSFGMTHLLVATHYEFHKSVVALIDAATPVALQLEEAHPPYKAAVITLFEVINRPRGSVLSEQLADADTRRDAALGELYLVIDAATRSIVPARTEAGKALKRMIAPYRGISSNEYNKETAQIRGLLRDLSTDPAVEYGDILFLGPVVESVRIANNTFATLAAKRARETGARIAELGDLDTTDQQRIVNELYATIVERENALALLTPTDPINAFIDNLNGLVAEYRTVIAKMRAGGTGTEEGTSPKDPEEPIDEGDGENEAPEEDPTAVG